MQAVLQKPWQPIRQAGVQEDTRGIFNSYRRPRAAAEHLLQPSPADPRSRSFADRRDAYIFSGYVSACKMQSICKRIYAIRGY
jgi:hypothetical protein